MPKVSTKTEPPRCRPAAPLPPDCDCLLSRDQVRTALGGVSQKFFDRLVARGEFPPADTRLGDLPRWRRRHVEAWIERRCRKETPS